ncbi:MAG: hypothetical protein ACE5J2_07115 [Nitrososphaerales archaeon]
MLHSLLDVVMLSHGFLTTFALMTAAGFIGLLVFSNEQRKGAINSLKLLALITTILVFTLNLTGAYGYMFYRLPDPDSAKMIIKETLPIAHEILFETMEYLSLVGPIWATMITSLTWHFKERIFTNKAVKSMMLILIVMAVVYALVIAYTGVVPTRIVAVR